jgi:N-acetyl sugar amidotransferase
MDILARNSTINIDAFAPDSNDREVKYGLPADVSFCRNCCVSNQRPNSVPEYQHTAASKKPTIAINEDGICDACKAADKKSDEIDWDLRRRELEELCDRYRRDDGGYDCLVPGSGGKDSFYAAHVLKTEFGMHPLTVTWAPHIYTEWGWHNMQSWIHAGFDNILLTPNGRVHRLLTRLATEILYHPFQPFIIGQKSIAPKYSVLHNIPLVFYGENEAEYGNPVADNQNAERDWSYFTAQDENEIYLSGVSIADLKEKFGVEDYEIQPYLPADPEGLKRTGTAVYYLGYYMKWHPQSCYYYSIDHSDFVPSPERTPGTYSKYNSIDDRMDDLHYYTTYIKFGIGRATYDASQEVRSNDITHDEALSLIKRYDGEFPDRFIDELLAYLSLPEDQFPVASRMFEQPIMDREYFEDITNRFRSPHLWKKEGDIWSLRDTAFS